MPDTPESLSQRLRMEGGKVISFFSERSPDHWQIPVYTDGTQWAVRDVLAHIVSAEQEFLRLFQNIQLGAPGISEGFSIDEFNRAQVAGMTNLDPQSLIARYRAARESMVAWVSSLSSKELTLTGRHPFLGSTTLAEMIRMVYLHNTLHLRDLRRLLGGIS